MYDRPTNYGDDPMLHPYEYISLLPAFLLFGVGFILSLYHRHLDPYHRYRVIGTFWMICSLLLVVVRISFGEFFYYILLIGTILSAFAIGFIKKSDHVSLVDFCRTYPDHEHCVDLQGSHRYSFEDVNDNGSGA